MPMILQGLAAFLAFGLYVVILELLPAGGSYTFLTVGIGTLIAAVWGRRLALPLRVFLTAIVFEFGFNACLMLRTMQPGWTMDQFVSAIFCFILFVTFPVLSFFRLWQRRFALALALASLPVSLGLASALAAFEEHRFVQQHREQGVGPTARWTVRNHWLAYDAKEQWLSGSD